MVVYIYHSNYDKIFMIPKVIIAHYPSFIHLSSDPTGRQLSSSCRTTCFCSFERHTTSLVKRNPCAQDSLHTHCYKHSPTPWRYTHLVQGSCGCVSFSTPNGKNTPIRNHINASVSETDLPVFNVTFASNQHSVVDCWLFNERCYKDLREFWEKISRKVQFK